VGVAGRLQVAYGSGVAPVEQPRDDLRAVGGEPVEGFRVCRAGVPGDLVDQRGQRRVLRQHVGQVPVDEPARVVGEALGRSVAGQPAGGRLGVQVGDQGAGGQPGEALGEAAGQAGPTPGVLPGNRAESRGELL
jgi:hypothetical protein